MTSRRPTRGKDEILKDLAALREELAAFDDGPATAVESSERMAETLHSLQVHQEELRTQNEQLRLTQLSLERTSNKYIDLFESSPIGYFIIDDVFQVAEINVAGMAMLRRNKGRIIGKPFLLFVDRDSRKALDEHFLRVRGGARASTELWLLPDHEPPFAVILESVPLTEAWGESWRCLSSAIDITDRKHAEMSLRGSEARLRAIFEQSPLAIQIVDGKGVARMSNRAWTRLWGGELGGRRAQGTAHPSPPPALGLPGHLADALAGRSREIPEIHLDGDGDPAAERWIRSHVYPIHGANQTVPEVVVIHEDITERKRVELALAERTTRLQRQYDNLRALGEIQGIPAAAGLATRLGTALDLGRHHLGLDIGVITHLSEDRVVVVHQSPAATEEPGAVDRDAGPCTLPLSTEDVVALPDIATAPADVLPALAHAEIRAYVGAPVRVRGELYGTVAFFAHRSSPRTFDEGDLDFMRLLARWIGAAIEEEEVRRDLAQSNAELEQFAYVASHDLRQPLRQVSSYVSLLERRYADELDATAHEFIAFAHDGAVRMDHLIVDLLEYSRIGRGDKPLGPVDLGRVIEEAAATLAPALHERGAVFTVAGPMPTVRGDSTDLVRLFQNLIGNAVKYCPPERTPEIRVTALLRGNEHEITVADNGIGIEPAYFDTIFRVFQRLHTPDKYEGTGIGLAICKKVVEQHHGRITITSTPGQGSAFHVRLPANL